MGDGDTICSLPRTCGRPKFGQINISELYFNITYNTFNVVNALIFKYSFQ
jgi:hypothetical protein